jgi:hypothetical protein
MWRGSLPIFYKQPYLMGISWLENDGNFHKQPAAWGSKEGARSVCCHGPFPTGQAGWPGLSLALVEERECLHL